MARFTQGLFSTSASTEEDTWIIEGGTIGGTQPTFDGDPLFSGEWKRWDDLVHFSINVEFDNITNFGTGQYYVKLPFISKNNYLLSDGCLHDDSTGDEYAVLGHVVEGSDILSLLSIASNGRQVHFTNSVPVNLHIQDKFHISGTYSIIV